jgi:hypothetical protein
VIARVLNYYTRVNVKYLESFAVDKHFVFLIDTITMCGPVYVDYTVILYVNVQ